MKNTATPKETKFESALSAAARKHGCDISALKVSPVVLDNTWGHLMGYAFIGPEDITERAARFCANWHNKEVGSGSYGCQRNIMDRGVRNVWIGVDEARGLGFEPANLYGQFEITARCVSTVYYPDAD